MDTLKNARVDNITGDADYSRRNFIRNSVLAAITASLGVNLSFAENMPADYVPLALSELDPFSIKDKHPEMIKLNDRPWNIEAAAHCLTTMLRLHQKCSYEITA